MESCFKSCLEGKWNMLHMSSSLEFGALFGILNSATVLLTSLLCRTLPPISVGNTWALLIPFHLSFPPKELILNKDCLLHLISPALAQWPAQKKHSAYVWFMTESEWRKEGICMSCHSPMVSSYSLRFINDRACLVFWVWRSERLGHLSAYFNSGFWLHKGKYFSLRNWFFFFP